MHPLSLFFLALLLVIAATSLPSGVAGRLGAASSELGVRTAFAQTALPPLPAGWPSGLQIGMSDQPNGAAGMRATAPFGFRYQYLAGGVNTGRGWATWNADGQFVTYYVQESQQHGMTPVFTYYMIYQSAPGSGGSEADAVTANLRDTATMTAYLDDLKLFFRRAGALGTKVVLHVEPDMWGYIQQRATGDDAATFPVQVAATGVTEVAGLPNNAAGLARAFVKLRDTYAPNVTLAYALSVWGTKDDIVYSDPPDATVDALATRAANFYRSLGASFDLAFGEFSDRDAAFKQYQYGDGGASWWNAEDFRRNVRFLGRFVSLTQKRLVMWQVPYGNTKMRAVNNTWDHYQDNRVEWLLDDPSRAHLDEYVRAGVVAFLFGRGADGATCACDAAGDGTTNPSPINGNTGESLSADDDGGFFRQKAAEYYRRGAIPLPPTAGGPTATPIPTATATPVTTATATPVATATATSVPTATATPRTTSTPVARPSFASGATAAPSVLRAGGTVKLAVSATSATATTAIVDIEVYGPSGAKVYQKWFENQAFAVGQRRDYAVSWKAPRNAAKGQYVVKVGVFSPDWGTNHHWNDSATTFTVR